MTKTVVICENPASKDGIRVWFSLSKCWPLEVHWGPRNSNHTFRAAENQHHLLPGEGSSHEGSIQAKTKLMEQGSLLTAPPCCQGLDDKYWYSWHLAQAQDLSLPIPSRLPLTFSQGPWKATIKETRILGYKQYKRNMPASGRHSFWCKSQLIAVVEDGS